MSGREPLVVAGRPGEAGRGPRQEQARGERARPRRRAPARAAPGRAGRTGAPAGGGSTPSTSASRAGRVVGVEVGAPARRHRVIAASLRDRPISCTGGYASCRTRGSTRGPSARRRRTRAPDPGLYGPASEAWRLNREAMLLLGAGPRALLLQLAHPAVAAGVDDHSDFRADPWRRLAGTLRSYLTIVYGTTAAARAEIRRLNALHRGIAGPGYAARDPELSLWVHATLVDSTIAVDDAWLEPLAARARGAFYAETRPIGRAFGVPEATAAARTSRRSTRTSAEMLGPAGPVQVAAARARAGRRRSCIRRSPAPLRPAAACRPARCTPGPCGRRSGCCRRRSARLRPAVGRPRAAGRRPGSSPAGAPGARCCRPSFRQMPQGARGRPRGSRRVAPSVDPREPRARTASPEVERRRRRRARRAASPSSRARTGWRRRSRAARPRTRSSPSAAAPSSSRLPPWM